MKIDSNDSPISESIETVCSRGSTSRRGNTKDAADRPIILNNVHRDVSKKIIDKESKKGGFSSKVLKLIHGIKSATLHEKVGRK
jgi:hypothetical protein